MNSLLFLVEKLLYTFLKEELSVSYHIHRLKNIEMPHFHLKLFHGKL